MIPVKTNILALFCLLGATRLMAQEAVPADIQPFITEGYELLDHAVADLDKNGSLDYIVILKVKGEDTIIADTDTPRPLLLLLRRENGRLEQHALNTHIVMCRNCGGAMGDPYQGVEAKKPGTFTLHFYGGSSWRWADSYTFSYDAARKDWFLESHASESFHSGDPDKTAKSVTVLRAETGDISLQSFTPDYNADMAEWEVKAVKTFFYNEPRTGAKPRKAFLLKGDKVQGRKTFTHFVECSFTNTKGQVTTGYILKEHLVRR